MKALVLSLSLLILSANAFAIENSVCSAKAIALAKAASSVDFSDAQILDASADQGLRLQKQNSTTWKYNVSLYEGGKFPMNYTVIMQESGPQSCYLESLAVQSN